MNISPGLCSLPDSTTVVLCGLGLVISLPLGFREVIIAVLYYL